MGQEWIIGVCLNLTGSLLINGGTNVMKLAHIRRAEKIYNESAAAIGGASNQQNESALSEIELQHINIGGENEKERFVEEGASPEAAPTVPGPNKPAQPPPIWKSKIWLLGFVFFTGGNALNFVSFGFAAQSLLAALGAVQFVSNVIFARFLLKEPMTWRVIGATVVITVCKGCLLPPPDGHFKLEPVTYARVLGPMHVSLLC